MTHSIVIAGDIFPIQKNMAHFVEGDVDSLFGEKLCDLFARADLSVCNLEGALTDHEETASKTGPVKVAPTSAVNAYQRLGINCCLLANNHVTDGGGQGVADTMAALDRCGIDYIGAGLNDRNIVRFKSYSIGELTFGLYNVSETMYNRPTATQPGAWLYDEYVVCREIVDCKKQCDYLVVVYHGGIEKFPYPSPELRKRFQRMADSGADMVVTQHTHCIGSEEHYNGSYLLYGQGDFLLKNFHPGLTDSGLLLELVVDGKNVQIVKHPVRSVDNSAVRYDEANDLMAFYQRSQQLSDEDYVHQELCRFCDGELRLYLQAFRNPSRYRMLQKRYMPSFFKKWLRHYTVRNLMFTVHTLRSEQNRETAIIGLERLLNELRNHS